MFNLIVRQFDWDSLQDSMSMDRMFEYTEKHLLHKFKANSIIHLNSLKALPCLFMHEGKEDELAYVGHIKEARIDGADIKFQYIIDKDILPLKNKTIYDNRKSLSMHEWEFSRNHWAIKEINLYRTLLCYFESPRRQRPKVFKIAEREDVEQNLVSAMMPFHPGFNPVYESIRRAAENVGLMCRRADDIWENVTVIDDVVSLIDRSRIVVCDCTNRNPNVFYEMGIAHTLGRDVVLITQSAHDVPFDIQHHRYIRYHDNAEGLAKLTEELQKRMRTITGR